MIFYQLGSVKFGHYENERNEIELMKRSVRLLNKQYRFFCPKFSLNLRGIRVLKKHIPNGKQIKVRIDVLCVTKNTYYKKYVLQRTVVELFLLITTKPAAGGVLLKKCS